MPPTGAKGLNLGPAMCFTFFSRIRGSELQYLFESDAAQRTLAENYVGMPL